VNIWTDCNWLRIVYSSGIHVNFLVLLPEGRQVGWLVCLFVNYSSFGSLITSHCVHNTRFGLKVDQNCRQNKVVTKISMWISMRAKQYRLLISVDRSGRRSRSWYYYDRSVLNSLIMYHGIRKSSVIKPESGGTGAETIVTQWGSGTRHVRAFVYECVSFFFFFLFPVYRFSKVLFKISGTNPWTALKSYRKVKR
jgi:hypothetical protein